MIIENSKRAAQFLKCLGRGRPFHQLEYEDECVQEDLDREDREHKIQLDKYFGEDGGTRKRFD